MKLNFVLMLTEVQTLDIISVNLWQIIISLCNLTIIFLLLKKFLYKPVMGVLEKRRADIEGDYAAADEARRTALASKNEYEEKLSRAEHEASELRKSAADDAKRHGEKIIAEAKDRADGMISKAEEQIELERKKAEADMKREIADVSARLAEKLIGREINEDTHRDLIDSFIDEVGDEQ